MADEHHTPHPDAHLSIGEVLGLLLEEFPDVTISKIRFLESQGLIAPERTSSGYRKFRDPDIELLRCILREQKENFLPLRVIKHRLDSGEIDPTGEQPRPTPPPATAPPRGIKNVPIAATTAPSTPSLLPGVLLTADELCAASGLSRDDLADLEQFGVVVAHRSSSELYDDDALEIASICRQLLDAGIDARHLRGWRVSAERESGLFEQLVQPMIRQRNPAAHAGAAALLGELEVAGGRLRSALVRASLRRFTTT
jgi:DNA-binding transcriptional MerR regulator